jgi:hypothetical protein
VCWHLGRDLQAHRAIVRQVDRQAATAKVVWSEQI